MIDCNFSDNFMLLFNINFSGVNGKPAYHIFYFV